MVWKNESDISTGKVHPDPDNCKTKSKIIIALPAFPNVCTQEYAIIENTKEQAKNAPIYAQIFSTYTHKNQIFHSQTINHWTIDIVRKNKYFQKNFSYLLHALNFSFFTLVENIAIINRLPTQIANVVKNGAIADP